MKRDLFDLAMLILLSSVAIHILVDAFKIFMGCF